MSHNSSNSHEPIEYGSPEMVLGTASMGDSTTHDKLQRDISSENVETAGPINGTLQRRAQYRVASLILTSVALVTALGSMVTAGIVFHHCNNYRGNPPSDSDSLSTMVSLLLYILVLVESILCVIAMSVCVGFLACKPEKVLLPAGRKSGSFACLCISVVVLFLLAGYAFVVPIICSALSQKPNEPAALCIVPAARFVALVGFFVVLILNRKLR